MEDMFRFPSYYTAFLSLKPTRTSKRIIILTSYSLKEKYIPAFLKHFDLCKSHVFGMVCNFAFISAVLKHKCLKIAATQDALCIFRLFCYEKRPLDTNEKVMFYLS